MRKRLFSAIACVMVILAVFSTVTGKVGNEEVIIGNPTEEALSTVYWTEDWEGLTPGEIIFPGGIGNPLPWFYDLGPGSLAATTPPPGSPPMQLITSMDTGNVSALLDTPVGGYFGMGEIRGYSATRAFVGNWIYPPDTNRFDLIVMAGLNTIIEIALINPGSGFQLAHWPGGVFTLTGIPVSINQWHELFVEYNKVTDKYSIWWDGIEYESQSPFIIPTNNFVHLIWYGFSGFNGYLDNLIHFSPPSHFPHLPIRINSNTDFDEAHGVVNWATGDGSVGNPWIIEGWDINGTGYGYCIYVGNTTEYFEVRECNLHEANGVDTTPYFSDSGLTLYFVNNGSISNNNIEMSNRVGVRFWSSNNNEINSNSVIDNVGGGIQMIDSSSNNTIVNNIIANNISLNQVGISGWGGTGINQYNNFIAYNNLDDCAIFLTGSYNTTIYNNTIQNALSGISISDYTTDCQVISNVISGMESRGIWIHGTPSANNITISNNVISDCLHGIWVRQSNNNIIANNNASLNNEYGIALDFSNANSIINNTVSLNYAAGIRLSSSDDNTLANNTASSNDYYGIWLFISNGNTVVNNTALNNYVGISFSSSSSSNTVVNNTASSNDHFGIHLESSSSNILKNNTMIDDGLYINGDQLEHWNTHNIDTYNSVNGKPLYYWKNQTGGTVLGGAGQVILANCSEVKVENQNTSGGSLGICLGFSSNNTIANNIASSNNYYGIYLYYSNNNTVDNNIASSNYYNGIYLVSSSRTKLANNTASSNNELGIRVLSSNDNTIDNNRVSYNFIGIYLMTSHDNKLGNNTVSNNDLGISITFICSGNTIANTTISNNIEGVNISFFSSNNKLYHNNFINNTNQASDNDANQWDNGYPSGGNYWSDYTGLDIMSGPDQDILGSDGIGDTNYTKIQDGPNVDNYPLMKPIEFKFTYLNLSLSEGWNLISLPLEQSSESLSAVLVSIAGKWDYIQAYDAINDLWLSNATSRPDSLNDLQSLDHNMAFWINITEPNVNLTVRGHIPSSTSINLYAGWNLVGYPTMSTEIVANALWGTGADRVEVFDPGEPYRIKEVGPTYLMKPGEGYWVHVPADTIWIIDW